MTVLVTMDFPATRDDIEAVSKEMRVVDDPPDGLIVHVATENDGGDIHIVDVWESAEHFERFAAERLGPTVHKVMADRGGSPPDGPSPSVVEAFDLVRGR
jgi:heme-degrading monooxygenase HmoA